MIYFELTKPSVYKFGPFQLDISSVRLTKNGNEIEVEPQVFNTLLLLIKHRERVVSKEELLATIWQGRVVTDSVITRIIYELRKLLDAHPEQESCIRTVRGKGYQFVAPVTATVGSAVGSNAVSKDRLTRKNRKWQIFSLVLLCALVIFLVVQYQFSKTNISSHKNTQQIHDVYPIVAVLPIEVKAGNDTLSMLVQSLIDYLTHQLALNLNVKVVHPDSMVNMEDMFDDVWAIQKATHSNFIIKGFIEPVAEQSFKLHLSLYKNNSAGELTPFSLGAFEFPYPQSTKELNDLYKQRKVTIRSIINIIKPGVVVKDNGDFETDDPEAYRLVIAAHHISRSDDCKDMQRAEQLLLNAVKRDDEFVYAYLQLFTNYYKRVWICGESTDYHQKGLAMAKIIDRLAPNSYKAVDIRRSTLLVESNQVEQAYEFSKNVDWNNPGSIYDESYSLRYAGFLNKTNENLDRILQLDPFFFNDKPIEQAPNTLLYQNRFKEHLALLAEPGNSYHDYFRGLNLFLNDETDQAAIVLKGVIERTPDDLFGKFSQALLSIVNNEDEIAVQIIDAISQQRTEESHTDGEMTYKLAQLYALANAKEQAIIYFRKAVDQGFFPMNYFLIDPALITIKESDQFADVVAQATQRHKAFAERFHLKPEIKTIKFHKTLE